MLIVGINFGCWIKCGIKSTATIKQTKQAGGSVDLKQIYAPAKYKTQIFTLCIGGCGRQLCQPVGDRACRGIIWQLFGLHCQHTVCLFVHFGILTFDVIIRITIRTRSHLKILISTWPHITTFNDNYFCVIWYVCQVVWNIQRVTLFRDSIFKSIDVFICPFVPCCSCAQWVKTRFLNL